jgi:ketosteroid isomerase-like protein
MTPLQAPRSSARFWSAAVLCRFRSRQTRAPSQNHSPQPTVIQFVIRHSLFVILLALSACSTNSPPQTITPLPVLNQPAARNSLRDADIAFSKLSEKKGVAEAFYRFLASDATVLLPGELPIEGRDAIRVHFAATPETLLAWTPEGAEVARDADLGYTWGDYELRGKGPRGEPQITYGKYVTIWKRQPDKTWKVVLHSGNSSPPPSARREPPG